MTAIARPSKASQPDRRRGWGEVGEWAILLLALRRH